MQDNEIINRILKGESDLYGLLVGKYSKRLFFLAWRLLRDKTEAEDAVQETFMKAYKALKGFRGDALFSTWIYRIAVNHVLNRLRKLSRHRQTDLDLDSISSNSTPLASSRTNSLREAVVKAVDGLPPRQRAIFHMRYEEDRSHREIAEILELSEGAVKASYHHAVLKLRESLKEFVDER